MGFFSKLCGKKKDKEAHENETNNVGEITSSTESINETLSVEQTGDDITSDTKKTSDESSSATCVLCGVAPKAETGDLCDKCNDQVPEKDE